MAFFVVVPIGDNKERNHRTKIIITVDNDNDQCGVLKVQTSFDHYFSNFEISITDCFLRLVQSKIRI